MNKSKVHTNTLLEQQNLFLSLSASYIGWKYALIRYLPNGNRINVFQCENIKEIRKYLLRSELK